MKKQIVVQHNSLIESAYKMTLTEQRLIRFCMATIRRDSLNNPRVHTVSVRDFNSTFMRKNTYGELTSACEGLMQKYVTTSAFSDDGGKWDTAMISIIEYAKIGEGRVELKFTESIMPLLEGLNGNHTTYPLNDVVRLKSVYSIRLYELLKQYTAIGERELSLDSLRKMFVLGKTYKVHKDFKKYVVDRAVDEINKHTPMHISYEIDKPGRKVMGYKFTFKYVTTEAATKAKDKELKEEVKRIKKACEDGQVVSLKSKKTGDVHRIFSFNGDYTITLSTDATHNLYELLRDDKAEVIIEPSSQQDIF